MPNIDAQRRALKLACKTELRGFKEMTPAEQFREMADWARENEVAHDSYGVGDFIAGFETKIAQLLGKPAAIFIPTGVMAQLIAVIIWSERNRLPRFGAHATSHLLIHEQQTFQALVKMHGVVVGHKLRPILASDFTAIAEPLSCLVVELPAREIGGQLPEWGELEALKAAAAEAGTPLHMDGARLWESRAYYQRTWAEIAEGFSSVYVSVYKGLGGISGSLLAGDEDFIRQARVWLRRLGGNVVTQSPAVVSTAMRLEKRLAILESCYQRTLSLTASLEAVPGIRILPRRPQVNMLHVYFDADKETLLSARDEIARQEGYWLFNALEEAEVPGWCKTEWYIGDNMLPIGNETVLNLFHQLMAKASR